jgi:hypothetical protein
MKSYIVAVLIIGCTVNAFAQQVLYCSGTVRYSSGKPAAGVSVAYYPGFHDGAGNYAEVKTDKKGRFAIIGPEDHTIFDADLDSFNDIDSIMARDVEKNLVAIQDVNMKTTNVDLLLQPGIALSGSVKDIEGVPIVGAMANLHFLVRHGHNGNGSIDKTIIVKGDDLGQFLISAIPTGQDTYGIEVTAKGYGIERIRSMDIKTNTYEFLGIVLKRADKKIAGRVLDKNGKPLAGVRVYFGGKGQPVDYDIFYGHTRLNPLVSAKTDSEGRFQFDAVCDAPLRVYAEAEALVDNLLNSLPKTNWPKNWPDNFGEVEKQQDAQAGDTNIVIQLQFSYPN